MKTSYDPTAKFERKVSAGGVCELTIFEDREHEWVAKPGSQTDRAREMVEAFIASVEGVTAVSAAAP
jgi:hypothetical protein